MADNETINPSDITFSKSPLSSEELEQLGRTKKQHEDILYQVKKQADILKGASWNELREKIRNKCETEPWWKIRKVITDENKTITNVVNQFLTDEKLQLADLKVSYYTLYRITEDCLKKESKTITKNLDKLEKEISKQRSNPTKFITPLISQRDNPRESSTKKKMEFEKKSKTLKR